MFQFFLQRERLALKLERKEEYLSSLTHGRSRGWGKDDLLLVTYM